MWNRTGGVLLVVTGILCTEASAHCEATTLDRQAAWAACETRRSSLGELAEEAKDPGQPVHHNVSHQDKKSFTLGYQLATIQHKRNIECLPERDESIAAQYLPANSTSFEEDTTTHMKPIGIARRKHCETVSPKWTRATVDVKNEHKNEHKWCTSCKPNRALVVVYPKARAGACAPFQSVFKISCYPIHGSEGHFARASPDETDVVCTKRGVAESVLLLTDLRKSNRTAYKHFKPARGERDQAVALCEVVKHTACVKKKGGKEVIQCAVRKQVNCRAVCKAGKYDWKLRKVSYIKKACFPKLCEHPAYGPMACRRVSQME